MLKKEMQKCDYSKCNNMMPKGCGINNMVDDYLYCSDECSTKAYREYREKMKNKNKEVRKKTILFDFDGVIHNHSSNNWKGINVIEGQPVEGIKKCIEELRKIYKIIVYSSRCLESKGIEAIKEWLQKHDIEIDGVTKDKLSYASIIIDDRAINFTGDTNKLINDIKKFVVWTKPEFKDNTFSNDELLFLKSRLENEIDNNSILTGKTKFINTIIDKINMQTS